MDSFKQRLSESYEMLWIRYPAVFYGLSALFGTFAVFHCSWVLFIPTLLACGFPLVIFSRKHLKQLMPKLFLALACAGAAGWHAHAATDWPELSVKGAEGVFEIEISSISIQRTSFGKRWVLRGNIDSFQTQEGKRYSHLPFFLSYKWKPGERSISTDRTYLFYGTIKPSSSHGFFLKAPPPKTWIPGKNTWSLALWRFELKTALKEYLHKNISDPESAAFLSGVATGDFDNPIMNFQLSRFGLQHIMAISGFHFSLIAGFFYFVLRLIFARRTAAAFLILIVSIYFLFLGYSPSIFRAWMVILLVQIGILFERNPLVLNSLGVALLIIVLLDPLICFHLGFQFSFATTAAILLFFSCTDIFMQRLFPKRMLSQLIRMSPWDQHGYVILAAFRQALALGIAVNLVVLPLSLYYFHKFSWISILYNLFFPFLVSISMLFLLLGLSLSLFPYLGECIHHINNGFTRFILNFTSQAPPSLDLYWRMNTVPIEGLVAYLSILFFVGLLLKISYEKHPDSSNDFIFL